MDDTSIQGTVEPIVAYTTIYIQSKSSFLLKTTREHLAKSNYHFNAKIDNIYLNTDKSMMRGI